MVRNWYKLYWHAALSQTLGAALRLSTMQVYDLLASHSLYLQTDQPFRKHPFQITLRVDPERRCTMFEVSLLSQETHGNTISDKVDPLIGLHRYQLVNAASDLNLPLECWHPFAAAGSDLFRAFETGHFLYAVLQGSFDEQHQVLVHHAAVDADHRSPLYQQPLLEGAVESLQLTLPSGGVACIGSGAGLVMAAADALHYLAADSKLGVHALAEIEEAHLTQRLQELLIKVAALKTHTVIVILYTTFVSCADVADILLQFRRHYPQMRLITHLEGIDAEESRLRLQAAGVPAVHGMAMIAQALHLASER